ncbi:MAG: glycoside hydrolase family 13 protein [Saprospiraceae bacterium]
MFQPFYSNPFKFLLFLSLAIIFSTQACSPKVETKPSKLNDLSSPPDWSQNAIWYQIFVERFRKGDDSNDPDLQSTLGSTDTPFPKDWKISPWGQSWYQQEDWAKNAGLEFHESVQMRRFGGDLQGVLDKLDYLEELGVNAIYFNPLNDAPSLHKFDARNYRHIDINFGPDPEGDRAIIQNENPVDTSTWDLTSADTLFFYFLKKAHQKNMHVILDYSWNHTGRQFWAWEDLVQNQENSRYKDWYAIEQFDDPATPENEFKYTGWANIAALPQWKKVNTGNHKAGHPYEGDLHPEVKQHIFNVTKKWMDPNGDGDYSDGIDGMRLDVAEYIPLGFWRDFRKYVRSLNPDFYLVGENWWTSWPDTLMNPVPWVQGDVFDAVMHYHWYKPTRGFFIGGADSLSKSEWQTQIQELFGQYRPETRRAMMNLAASHDTPRLSTSLYNKNKYKYHCKPSEDPYYRTDYPMDWLWNLEKLLILHQFTFVGSPHIWNGDELGMWGADDPDNRKPLWWKDFLFQDETPSSFSDFKYIVRPRIRKDVLRQYTQLSALRKAHPALRNADFEFLESGDERVVMYERKDKNETLLVILNVQQKEAAIEIPDNYQTGEVVFGDLKSVETILKLKPFEGLVLKR